jgi:PAS domain S-box-containing protein
MSVNNLLTDTIGQQNGTIQKSGQAPLHDSLETIIACSPDKYLILSPDFIIQMATDAYLDASLTKREEISGKYLFDVFPDNGSDAAANTINNIRASLRQVLSTKKPHRMDLQRYDLPQPMQKGTGFIPKYWLLLHTPVLDDKGEVLCIIHKMEDVTEEVNARRRMEESEALLLSTEDIAHTGSYQIDLSSGTFRFSDGLFRLFGQKPGSFEPSLDFIDSRSHPEDIVPIREILKGAAIDKKPYYYTRRIYSPNGELRTLEVQGKVVGDGAGNAIKLLGMVQDITGRKNAHDQMLRLKDELARQASDKYHTLFDAIDEGFFRCELLFDQAGLPVDIYYLEANQAATRMVGEDFTGRRLKEINPEYEAYWYEIFGRVAQTGQGERLEQYAQPDKKWYSFYVFKVANEAGNQVAVLFKDISERKQQEEALRESEARNAADLAGMRRLYELQAKLAGQTDLQAALRDVLAVACEFTGIDRGCVQLLSPNGERLEMFVWQGYPDDSPFISYFRYEGLETGCEVTRIKRQRLIIEDTVGFPGLAGTRAGAATYADGIRAAQSTPMTSRSGETIGVISTQFRQPHRPGDHELRLLDMLAWTAGEYLERHRADAARRESDERYRQLFNSIDEGFCTVEVLFDEQERAIDYRFLDTNPTFDAQTGLANATGRTMRELVPYHDEFWFEIYGKVALTGESIRFERFSVALNRWFSVYALRVGEPENRQVAIVFSDISERKLAEQQLQELMASLEAQVAERTQALRESNDLLQLVFDTSPMAISVQEAVRDAKSDIQDFRVLLLNKELARELGRTDMVGKHYVQEYPGLKASGLFDLMRTTVETGKPQHMEYYYPYEGFNRWFSCTFVKLNDGVMAINLDITPRKLAEQDLNKNLTLLRQAEQVSRMGSWEYDLATKNFSWSEGMYRLFGLPLGSPVKPEIYLDYALPADLPIAEKIVGDIKVPRLAFEETLRILVDGLEVTLKIKAIVPAGLPGVAAKVLGLDIDISEVKQLEEQNLRMRLEQQNALLAAIMEAQEEERRRISESLHNGVGQLLYATKLNLSGVKLDPIPAQKAQVAEALKQTDGLLTEAIVEIRRVSHELVPILLKDFGLKLAMEEFCNRFGRTGIKFDCHCLPERLSPLLEMAIYRISQELVNNIVKHSGATRATLEVNKDQKFVYLDARDNGKGMDQNILNLKNSDRPWTSKGIGLRTIWDRVRLLNGTLEMDSTPEGTLISICLPLGRGA